MAGTHTLSGDLKTVLGTEDFTRLRARVELLGSGRTTDPATGETRLGGIDLILATEESTEFSVELPDETWDPSPWYRIAVDYNALASPARVPSWISGEFQMDQDRNLADLPVEAPVAFDPATYENLSEIRDEAVAAAEAAAAVGATSDAQTAANINTGPLTEAALLATTGAQVETLVPPLVVDALADDETILNAAEAAVDTKVDGLDLLLTTDPQAPRVQTDLSDDVTWAVHDSGGRLSQLALGTDGHFHAYAKTMLRTDFFTPVAATDYVEAEQSTVDSAGRRSWLEVDKRGRPTRQAADLARESLAGARYGVAKGDSTTEGDGLTTPSTERWTALLSTLAGIPIQNHGSNGQTAEQICARWGSLIAIGTVSGGSIAASGATSLSLDVDLVVNAYDTTFKAQTVDLRAEDGTLVRGVLTTVGSTNATNRQFIRETAGSAISSTRVEVFPVLPRDLRDGIFFLGMGVNNEAALDAGTQTIAQIQALYRGATSLLVPGSRKIIWGMLDRGLGNGSSVASEAPGTTRGTYIAALETWLAQEYGTDFVSVRKYLSTARALTDAAVVQPGFTPTTDDNNCVAAGCTPSSFRVSSGSVHLNALGHKLQARLFHRHMTSPMKGWI